MKILSWNIKRPKMKEMRIQEITEIISDFSADLIFLTEQIQILSFLNMIIFQQTNFHQSMTE